jgi:fatty acid amide hydrolase 2
MDLCQLTLDPLRTLLDNREISAVELVEAHIKRLQDIDSRTKALAVQRFDEARREAHAADRLIARGEGGSLTGVPCTIKEFIGIKGLPQTGGIKAYQHRVALRDSPVTARLREAGAIILATTNVPEGGLWMECDNPVYGVTRNPWNPKLSPGGSSGGEAVSIASGGAVFGIGSDIGGSIRIPAGMCGAIAHKPSGRLVPTTDHFPPSGAGLAPLLSIGPFARCVEDLDSILRIIAGPDSECPVAEPQSIRDFRRVDIAGLRVLRLETPFPRVRPIMKQAVNDACDALANAGAKVISYRFPELARTLEIWGALLDELSEQPYAVTLGGGTPINPLLELLKYVMGRRQHTPAALMMTAIERVTGKIGPHVSKMADLGRRLRVEINEALEDDGILLFPPYTSPAPRLYEPLLRPLDGSCTPLFNICESAVSVVPTRFHKGLPVCVQLIAAKGCDHIALASAAVVEAAYGGWVRAPAR